MKSDFAYIRGGHGSKTRIYLKRYFCCTEALLFEVFAIKALLPNMFNGEARLS